MEFLPSICHKTVKVLLDSAMAVAYISRQGCTWSAVVATEAIPLLQWEETHLLVLLASHLSGKGNLQVDYLSCTALDPGEWALSRSTFQRVVARWGQPVMDLIVTQMNAKAEHFFSLHRPHMSEGLDALVHPLPRVAQLYIFPPPLPLLLIGQILQQIVSSGERGAHCSGLVLSQHPGMQTSCGFSCWSPSACWQKWTLLTLGLV